MPMALSLLLLLLCALLGFTVCIQHFHKKITFLPSAVSIWLFVLLPLPPDELGSQQPASVLEYIPTVLLIWLSTQHRVSYPLKMLLWKGSHLLYITSTSYILAVFLTALQRERKGHASWFPLLVNMKYLALCRSSKKTQRCESSCWAGTNFETVHKKDGQQKHSVPVLLSTSAQDSSGCACWHMRPNLLQLTKILCLTPMFRI